MRSEVPPKAICPHCGSEFDYEELCGFCGKLVDGDIPVQKVSLTHFLGNLFSRPKGKGFDGGMNMPKDIGEEPSLNPFPGSSWYIHYHDYDND